MTLTSSPPSLAEIAARIRDVPDFPKPGIVFKDLTPCMGHGPSFARIVELLCDRVAVRRADAVVGIESRGFIFGAPVAARLGLGFVPVRKPGKLPWKTARKGYALEYGTDALEMHADAVVHGARVVVLDDLLATGGTAAAALDLVRQVGGRPVGLAVVVELAFLGGRGRLGEIPVDSLLVY